MFFILCMCVYVFSPKNDKAPFDCVLKMAYLHQVLRGATEIICATGILYREATKKKDTKQTEGYEMAPLVRFCLESDA